MNQFKHWLMAGGKKMARRHDRIRLRLILSVAVWASSYLTS